MKIRFESDDDLPLGKILSIPMCIIVVGSAFQEDNNYYPQVYLYECLHEFCKSIIKSIQFLCNIHSIALIICF